MSALSYPSRPGCSVGSRTSASTPWSRAMSSAPAPERSERTTTTSARMRPAATPERMARRLEPRPEASTPTRRRGASDILDPACPGADLPQLEDLLPRRSQGRRGRAGIARAYREAEGREGADPTQDLGPMGGRGQPGDAPYRLVAGGDVHTGRPGREGIWTQEPTLERRAHERRAGGS